jgi:hypothetical protein
MTVKQFFERCDGSGYYGGLGVHIYCVDDPEDADVLVYDMNYEKIKTLPPILLNAHIYEWDVYYRDGGDGVAIRIGLLGTTEDYDGKTWRDRKR